LAFVARAITGLTVGKFGADELRDLLNCYLDTLAISRQARRGITPILMGFTKVMEVRLRGLVDVVLCPTTLRDRFYWHADVSAMDSTSVSVAVLWR